MKHLLSLILLLALPACVKIKDKGEGEGGRSQVRSFQVRNLTIDEPYYLMNGELVRAKDFEPESEQNLKAQVGDITEYVLGFDHLVLKEGGIIYTMGQIVRLHVEDLESRGGLITTFPDSMSAALNVEGLSGGQLLINANHARGDLKVFMTGQKGGQGIKGEAGQLRIAFIAGGAMGATCKRGNVGDPGKEGARGGISGSAEIFIRDDADFNLEVRRRGGLGGEPGEGGEGSEGTSVCRKNPIFRGPKGPPGERGPEGQLQTVCVKKGEKPRQCL